MGKKTITNSSASAGHPDYDVDTNTGAASEVTPRVILSSDSTVGVNGLASATSGTTDAAGTENTVYVRPITPSADIARIGATNESAAASDTATSGLNGLLKRVAQNITTLIGKIPSAIGTAFFTRISDGTNTANVNAPPTYSAGETLTGVKALDTIAHFSFLWDSAYTDTPTADNKAYAGVMNDYADFMMGIGSIRNVKINAGHGTATTWTTSTQQAGSPRVAQSGAATATLTNVSASASTVSLLASQVRRAGAIFFNDSDAILYLAFAATSSTTAFTYRIDPYGTLELPMPVYTGAISGIWSSATGAVRITELT